MKGMERSVAELVTEAAVIVMARIKFSGKVKPFEKVLFGAFAEWMLGGASVAITLKARESLGKSFGYVRPADLEKGKYEVHFEAGGSRAALGAIAHELTHVLQYLRGDLDVVDGTFVWKKTPALSVEEYNGLGYSDYSKLPWEKEAIRAQKTKADEFIGTKLQELKGADPSLDFIIDHGWLV